MARQMNERSDDDRSAQGQAKSDGNGGRQKADAIEMLKADHRRVEEHFDKYGQARRRAEKSTLAQQICLELAIHAAIEEEIFYPACREHVDDLLLDEAQVEHDTAKILIAEIAMGSPQSDPYFDAKVMVLGEYIRAHVQEEEKNADSIFAKALEGGVDAAKLGQRMLARREELMEEFADELMLTQPRALHVRLAQDEEAWAEAPGAGARGGAREMTEGRESQGRESQGRDMQGRGGADGWREGGRGGQQETRGARGRESERGGEGGGATGHGATGHDGGEEHRGWHGDPKRHSEASRKGWEHRR